MALTLVGLYEHPLKSCYGNAVESAQVESEGLLHDRRFLAHTLDGTFISGRSHPRLVQIRATFDGVLTLSAPGVEPLVVHPQSDRASAVAVWAARFTAWDQGEEASRWLSSFLNDEVRLAWLGNSQRVLRWDESRRVNFADAAPLTGLGTASVAEISRRVGEALSVRRFRPNLVIEGGEPFEEDSWLRFRVGEVEFQALDGCGRCEFTTLDPETGEAHPRREPVATLETFRKTDTGIYVSMNLMPVSTGTLRVGDRITVVERRRPLFFGAVRPLERAIAGLPVGTPWPEGAAALRCVSVRDAAAGVKTFVLERVDGQAFSWRAGQYLTLKLEFPEGPVRRSYSLSSAAGTAEITVRRLEGGRVSSWLHDHLTVGGVVVGEAVGGSFTVHDHPWESLLLLGAGSGVTPLISMLKWLAENDLPVDVAFHQSARTRADLLFQDELVELKARLGARLTVGERVTSERGRLDRGALVKFCPDLRDRRAFVCGPNEYRASMREALALSGFKLDRRYHEELFGEAALEVPAEVFPGEVTFSRTRKTVASDGRTTLLQLAERSGIDLPSSCRSGDCGTCRVKMGGEWVLACHTFPQGSVTLDL